MPLCFHNNMFIHENGSRCRECESSCVFYRRQGGYVFTLFVCLFVCLIFDVIFSIAKGTCPARWTFALLEMVSSSFKCSLDNAKRSFYRSFNAIFGGKLVESLQMKSLYS